MVAITGDQHASKMGAVLAKEAETQAPHTQIHSLNFNPTHPLTVHTDEGCQTHLECIKNVRSSNFWTFRRRKMLQGLQVFFLFSFSPILKFPMEHGVPLPD